MGQNLKIPTLVVFRYSLLYLHHSRHNILKIVSLSISTVFYISLTTHCCRDFSFTSFFICSFSFSIPPPKHPTTKGIISTTKPTRLLRISNANSWYFCNFLLRFCATFASSGQAISAIQIIHPSASSRVRSGLLAVVVFLILYSKSNTSFLPGFSMTVPFFHPVLYHAVLRSSKPASFHPPSASTIKAFLRLLRYSLPARTLQLASRCTVSLFSLCTVCKPPIPPPFPLKPSRLWSRPFALTSLLLLPSLSNLGCNLTTGYIFLLDH